MKNYTGTVETVDKNASVVYDFLSDFKHFSSFLPSQIQDWECDENYCAFSVQGLGKLKLVFKERILNSLVVVQPATDSGFPVEFYIKIHINQHADNVNKCDFQFVIEANVNAMIAMMVDKPLTQFVEVVTQRLKMYFS